MWENVSGCWPMPTMAGARRPQVDHWSLQMHSLCSYSSMEPIVGRAFYEMQRAKVQPIGQINSNMTGILLWSASCPAMISPPVKDCEQSRALNLPKFHSTSHRTARLFFGSPRCSQPTQQRSCRPLISRAAAASESPEHRAVKSRGRFSSALSKPLGRTAGRWGRR